MFASAVISDYLCHLSWSLKRSSVLSISRRQTFEISQPRPPHSLAAERKPVRFFTCGAAGVPISAHGSRFCYRASFPNSFCSQFSAKPAVYKQYEHTSALNAHLCLFKLGNLWLMCLSKAVATLKHTEEHASRSSAATFTFVYPLKTAWMLLELWWLNPDPANCTVKFRPHMVTTSHLQINDSKHSTD